MICQLFYPFFKLVGAASLPEVTGTLIKQTLRNLFCVGCVFLMASTALMAQSDRSLASFRADELSSEQLRQFVREADRLGVTDAQIESYAVANGISPLELVRFRDLLQNTRKAMANEGRGVVKPKPTSSTARQDTLPTGTRPNYSRQLFDPLVLRPFGSEIFNNDRLSFEPELRIPTPLDYRLAAGDGITIYVSGLSEANYKLEVTNEGLIKIPVAGSVSVTGLTMEEATRAIRSKLSSTIYKSIKTGKTKVAVTLSTVRSIRVAVIGEAFMPGTYTIPSIASAFHVLYASGGPSSSGTLRKIQVIRNNKVVSTIDVYDYLTKGIKRNDIRLMDNDVIRIFPYEVRIGLNGEVRKPGLYDVLPGESLDKIIRYAGGYSDIAYTSKIRAYQSTGRERRIATIDSAAVKTIFPTSGDVYTIDRILNRFQNRITVRGAVFRPGEYEWKKGMTLKQLIDQADGIREDAYLTRGTIQRLKEDLSPELVSFNLQKINKDSAPDIVLYKEDRVTIYSRFDLKEGYFITIDGEVANPGVYPYAEKMTPEDLIILAGGLKESSFTKKVEISRRVKDADPFKPDSKTAVIFQKDINSDLREISDSGVFYLQPFDELSIRVSPGYAEQQNIVVEGEVLYPGKYTLDKKNSRISELIGRSGGLTPDAYPKGSVLIRSVNRSKSEQSNYTKGYQNLIKQNILAGTPQVIVQSQIEGAVNLRSQLVGIELEKIMDDPGSKYDLLLQDGDTIRIPKLLQTVRVNGEVLFPTIIRYDGSSKFKDYVIAAGGYSDRSQKKKSFVVHSNGSAEGTKSFLFFKSYPRIKPGDEIYIPTKREKERLRAIEFITIGATLVSMLAILATLIK
jgi:protein involved in polysaccharide export with SLBB domain